MSNVSGKFFLPSWASEYAGRSAVFFDDVLSTGATAIECSEILRRSGIRETYGYFLSGSSALSRRESLGFADGVFTKSP